MAKNTYQQRTVLLTIEEFEAMKNHIFYLDNAGQVEIRSKSGDKCCVCEQPIVSEGEGIFDANRGGFVCISCDTDLVFG
jgi:hypothetical protein